MHHWTNDILRIFSIRHLATKRTRRAPRRSPYPFWTGERTPRFAEACVVSIRDGYFHSYSRRRVVLALPERSDHRVVGPDSRKRNLAP